MELDHHHILWITTAYEQGFGHAFRDELSNPYKAGSAEAQAWDMGREEGRTKQKPTEPTEAQIDYDVVYRAAEKLGVSYNRLAAVVRAALAGEKTFERLRLQGDEFAELARLREEVKGPDGFATWRDAAVSERREKVKFRTELAQAKAEVEQLTRDNKKLRQMLAFNACPLLYTDDGELSDSTAHPSIDFKRDTVEAIEAKFYERNRRAFAAKE